MTPRDTHGPYRRRLSLDESIERRNAMLAMQEAGASLEQIGLKYDMSRQRVSYILAHEPRRPGRPWPKDGEQP